MKKLLIVACALLAAAAAHAQGTVNFNNRATASGVNAPIFDVDGTTRLAGTGFSAALYGGAAGSAANSLTLVGAALNFRTGTAAGFVVVGENSRAIPGVIAGNQAAVQIRAWDSAATSWEDAVARGLKHGESGVLNLATGGTGVPAGPPTDLVGLQSFSLVPEPSSLALAGIGAAALLLRRRK